MYSDSYIYSVARAGLSWVGVIRDKNDPINNNYWLIFSGRLESESNWMACRSFPPLSDLWIRGLAIPIWYVDVVVVVDEEEDWRTNWGLGELYWSVGRTVEKRAAQIVNYWALSRPCYRWGIEGKGCKWLIGGWHSQINRWISVPG